MNGYDPIPEIEKLGYTPRESAFLYLAAMHAGYFLRRQYNRFVARADGAIGQQLTEKLIERRHAEVIDYGQKRFVFHLSSKTIYRLLSSPDSQSRRLKGDREIKARLMQLDFLLDHLDERWLETEQAKVMLFHEKLGIPLDRLPQVRFRSKRSGACQTRYFLDRSPIAVGANGELTFGFIDDGSRTVTSFAGYLSRYEALLRSVRTANVVYVADSERNFAAAEREFLRVFPKFDPAGASQGSLYGETPSKRGKQRAPSVSLRGYLLTYSYPVLSPRYRGTGL
jgi:hypothetical protein